MDTRRWIAGRLIRLAHKVYPPKVTVNYDIHCADDAGRTIGRDLAQAIQYGNYR